MTDLAVYEAQFGTTDPTGGRLVAWADAARSAHLLGTSLAKTSFVPADFRGKPDECAAAILFGDEIGLSPMQALQSVYVIKGKPALYARAMVAVVLAAGHDIVTVEKTDSKVTVKGRRHGAEDWTTETWTTDRAKRAGYTNNGKYQSDPQAMLYARAAGDVCRQVAPDALAGLAISAEEIQLEDAPTATVTRAPRTVSRNKAPEPIEPPLDTLAIEGADEPTDAEIIVDGPPPLPSTQGQHSELTSLFNVAGVKGPDRPAFIAGFIGREVDGLKALTLDEASALIAHLTPEPSA